MLGMRYSALGVPSRQACSTASGRMPCASIATPWSLSDFCAIVTILRMRAPGMDLMKMPVFVWTELITNILIVAIFPVLAATLALPSVDRYLDMHFFTNELGGNARCTSTSSGSGAIQKSMS
jgi:Cytochrome C and Quinol oxidase polypeptide I